ncbi:hypothetical protein P691DRAFT_805200 [Macrolepiota fuliginosa MF-IS2]|uniref:Required for respiratory growth protein 9, mitochondrial n=1 Tax=Macrolepiota fuliginosa MF-IS2 TaxID=1400762 RepID=A0A9P5X784_9AGAR|nr:hypothetical protein P691DRAFT_805200 [Macrolepiota fuliginosa MF-IS2]
MASRALSSVRALRRYSTQQISSATISAEARRKWGLSGMPSPRSILNDDSIPVDLTEDDDIVNGARPNTPPPHLRKPPTSPTPTEWRAHRESLKRAFPNGWSPPRKLSREAMDGLRELNRFDPQKFSTPVLAERFKISPEAVRRILKSKWEPSPQRRAQWAMRQRKQRDEKTEYRRQTRLKEMQETEDILLAKQFSGGLSLKG